MKILIIVVIALGLKACSSPSPSLPINPLIGLEKGLWMSTDPTLTYTNGCGDVQKVPSWVIGDDFTKITSYVGRADVTNIRQEIDGSWEVSFLDKCKGFRDLKISTSSMKDTLYMTFEKKDRSIVCFSYVKVLSKPNLPINSLKAFEASLRKTCWKESIDGKVQRFIMIYGREQNGNRRCLSPPKTDTINDCKSYWISFLYDTQPRDQSFGLPSSDMDLEYLSGFYRINAKVYGKIRYTSIYQKPDDLGHIVNGYDIEKGRLTMLSIYDRKTVVWERTTITPYLDSLWPEYEKLMVKSEIENKAYKEFNEYLDSYITKEENDQGYEVVKYDLDKAIVYLIKRKEPDRGHVIVREIDKTPYLDSLRLILWI